MQRPIPLKNLLRFPIIFGTFLVSGGLAFYYREHFLGDIEGQRESLMKENIEHRKLLEQKKLDYKQTKQ